jgi:hypothetical protein
MRQDVVFWVTVLSLIGVCLSGFFMGISYAHKANELPFWITMCAFCFVNMFFMIDGWNKAHLYNIEHIGERK